MSHETTGSQSSSPMPELSLDESRLHSAYANFCRVTGTAEELIVDFGLNAQVAPSSQPAMTLEQRVVLSYLSAKRLLVALHAAVQRHEATFGVLELDSAKRVRQTPQAT